MSISADRAVEVGHGNFHGWLIVTVAILMQTVVSGVAISSFSFWIPAWMETFGVGRAHIMTTLTAALVVSALVGPIGGYLMDRWSVRWVACVGLLIFSIGATLIGSAQAFWQIQVLYAITFGLGLGLAGTPAAQTMTAKAFDRKQGAALSLVVVGLMLGGVIMPKIIASLLTSYDWRTVTRCISIGSVALIPIVGSVVRIHARTATQNISAQSSNTEWTLRSILATPSFWILLIVFLPEYGAMMGYIANVAQFSAGWGLSASDAASYLSLTGFAAVCVTPFVGRIADRFDPRYVLLAGYLLAGSGFLFGIGAQQVVQIVAACLLIGIGTAFFYPMQGILVARQFGSQSFGRALGLLNFFLLIGAAAGPAGGALRDKFGNYTYFFVLCALLPVICSAALFVRVKPAQQSG
jgi:MFS family permease